MNFGKHKGLTPIEIGRDNITWWARRGLFNCARGRLDPDHLVLIPAGTRMEDRALPRDNHCWTSHVRPPAWLPL